MDARREVKVADEVWLIAALLHREHPEQADFSVEEIVERARKEGIGGRLRPGVYVHAVQHCVANRPPNPGRYCMLFETSSGRRRLWRPGDKVDGRRSGAKSIPQREETPPRYQHLLDWYLEEYAGSRRDADDDPILGLRGLGKAIRDGEHPDAYVNRLRAGWE